MKIDKLLSNRTHEVEWSGIRIMFALADESYAPSNARDDVKAAATAVIGHHDEDGISEFLRQRFKL